MCLIDRVVRLKRNSGSPSEAAQYIIRSQGNKKTTRIYSRDTYRVSWPTQTCYLSASIGVKHPFVSKPNAISHFHPNSIRHVGSDMSRECAHFVTNSGNRQQKNALIECFSDGADVLLRASEAVTQLKWAIFEFRIVFDHLIYSWHFDREKTFRKIFII